MRFPFRELVWLGPFVCLGLFALIPLRPWPVFPPVHGRVVPDGQGNQVEIPLPVHVISMDGAVDYLELTHAPEALFKAGGKGQHAGFDKGMWARFYPQLAQNDCLWDNPGDMESLLAQDNGATYFTWNPSGLRRIGLAAVGLAPRDMKEFIATLLRVENVALGQKTEGEALLADFRKSYDDLRLELKPETLTFLPRILPMGSSSKDWSNVWVSDTFDMLSDQNRIGVKDASAGFKASGRQQEAERILAMNPDIIFAGGADDILRDPRWQGLKAVQNKRVYGGFGVETGVPSWRFDVRPLAARWAAEIVHPERLEPKMRELLRDHFLKMYGYRFSDTEIDRILSIAANRDSIGYERFTKDYHSTISSMDHRQDQQR